MAVNDLNRTRVYRIIVAAFVMAAVVFLTSIILRSQKDDDLTVTDTYMKISGIRSQKVNFADIENMELRDSMPEIEERIMGSAVGSKKKGSFKVKNMGVCGLYINTNIKSYIFFTTKKGYTIINYKDEAATRQLYEDINMKLAGIKKQVQ